MRVQCATTKRLGPDVWQNSRRCCRRVQCLLRRKPTVESVVPSCCGNLCIGWESYWWQNDNALMIRQHRAVAVEADDAAEFVVWLAFSLTSVLKRVG